jgi:hypothetical protein
MWFNFAHLFSVSLLPLSTAWMAVSELGPESVSFYAAVFFDRDPVPFRSGRGRSAEESRGRIGNLCLLPGRLSETRRSGSGAFLIHLDASCRLSRSDDYSFRPRRKNVFGCSPSPQILKGPKQVVPQCRWKVFPPYLRRQSPNLRPSSSLICSLPDRSGALEIAGRSWQEHGTLSARYWSEAVKEKNDPAGVFYYWKGERPMETNAPRLEGTGGIRLESADRASSYLTTRADLHPELNARTAGVLACRSRGSGQSGRAGQSTSRENDGRASEGLEVDREGLTSALLRQSLGRLK